MRILQQLLAIRLGFSIMDDFRTRLLKENDDLTYRLEKLKTFIVSQSFDSLPEIERTDLKEQLRHMEQYANVLSRRVSRLCTGNN